MITIGMGLAMLVVVLTVLTGLIVTYLKGRSDGWEQGYRFGKQTFCKKD